MRLSSTVEHRHSQALRSGRDELNELIRYMETLGDTLSTVEAAALLGISVSTVRRRIASGEIPHVVIGSDFRIPQHAVAANPVIPTNRHDPLDGLPAFLTVRQVAEILGWNEDQVRYHCRLGHLPVRKFGKLVRIPTSRFRNVMAGLE